MSKDNDQRNADIAEREAIARRQDESHRQEIQRNNAAARAEAARISRGRW